nr:GNAT family N-acetyltransferase [Actinomycetota bacterium]
MDVRWGQPDDAGELVRLRALMWDSMGVGRGDDWHGACEEQLKAGLADGVFFAAVVDRPDGSLGLAACGVGMVWQALAGPGDGRIGYIQSMCTDTGWRGRGLARALLD